MTPALLLRALMVLLLLTEMAQAQSTPQSALVYVTSQSSLRMRGGPFH